MSCETPDVLLIGYGNPGRLDDGLGPALAKAIEKLALPGVKVDSDYQLSVEDGAEAAKHKVVIFADADEAGSEPFWMKRIYPGTREVSFSSHSITPEAVLAIARDLFKGEPACYLLGIRGYEFNEFCEKLSQKAKANLDQAVTYVATAIRENKFREIRPEGAEARNSRDEEIN